MESYGAYIWSAYGLTLLLMTLLVITSYRSLKKHQKELDILQHPDSEDK